MFKHFRLAGLYAAASLLVAFVYGGLSGFIVAAALGCLEVSLSLDNAVVNAKTLDGMNPVWRRRFLTWGMLIAVFGMRLVFPLAIVSASAWISPKAAVLMALHAPAHYAAVLSAAHIQITGFGGAFLLMLFFDFFLDEDKVVHWIEAVECPMIRIGHVNAIGVACTALVLIAASLTLPVGDGVHLLQCGMCGIVGYILAEGASELIGGGSAEAKMVAKAGAAGFFFLEIQDASFSFDGVIGALAVSNNLLIIALGLGIGAMFVRSITLMLVESHTLAEMLYLEHGAFWAVGTMAGLMFVKLHYEIPDAITGVLMALIIGSALGTSIIHNRKVAVPSAFTPAE